MMPITIRYYMNRCEEPAKYRGVQVYDSLNKPLPPRTDYPVRARARHRQGHADAGKKRKTRHCVTAIWVVMVVMVTVMVKA